jgi:hypothetical protein
MTSTQESLVISVPVDPARSSTDQATPPTNSWRILSYFFNSKAPSSPKHDRKWRWWHQLTIFLVLLVLSEILVLSYSYEQLNSKLSPVRIGMLFENNSNFFCT